jgi:hypothetical protein
VNVYLGSRFSRPSAAVFGRTTEAAVSRRAVCLATPLCASQALQPSHRRRTSCICTRTGRACCQRRLGFARGSRLPGVRGNSERFFIFGTRHCRLPGCRTVAVAAGFCPLPNSRHDRRCHRTNDGVARIGSHGVVRRGSGRIGLLMRVRCLARTQPPQPASHRRQRSGPNRWEPPGAGAAERAVVF